MVQIQLSIMHQVHTILIITNKVSTNIMFERSNDHYS